MPNGPEFMCIHYKIPPPNDITMQWYSTESCPARGAIKYTQSRYKILRILPVILPLALQC